MNNPFLSGIMDNSPIIIAIIFTSFSFIFQSYPGIVYLAYLIASVIIRQFIIQVQIWISGTQSTDPNSCQKNNITAGFSTFVFMFTFWYAFLPMFVYNDLNLYLLIAFIFYFVFDLIYKISDFSMNIYDACDQTRFLSLIGVNFLAGSILGASFCGMMLPHSSSFLFFNEISTSKEMCSIKKEQAFKCKVNK
jgi:hypothetical protein